jgi:ribosomal protein L11 methyltransferase
MPWLQLALTLHAEQQVRVEAALQDLGALAITLQDADAETPDERAIFEPGVGETPLWKEIVLQALFSADADRGGLAHALHDLVPELAPDRFHFHLVDDADWTRAWMDAFRPMRFGLRLWIYPWNIDPPAGTGDEVIVRLDPGLAFGTGTHPTTALCLEWLDAADLQGKTVIDYGCGSGVLAIAALKLGAARVIGVDNDPQALAASRDNAERNGIASALELHLPDHASTQAAHVLVANILAGALHDLAPLFAQRVAPGGNVALSGILREQSRELLARYAEWFDGLAAVERDDWVRISGTRKI